MLIVPSGFSISDKCLSQNVDANVSTAVPTIALIDFSKSTNFIILNSLIIIKNIYTTGTATPTPPSTIAILLGPLY